MKKQFCILLGLAGLLLLSSPLPGKDLSTYSRNRIQGWIRAGKLEEARKTLEEFLSRNPAASSARLLLGENLLLQEEPEAASRQLEELLKEHPRMSRALALQGKIQLRLGEFEKAEKLFQASLATDPGQAEALLGIGRLSLSRMKVEEAVEFIGIVVKKNPRLADAHYYLAEAYGLSRKLDRQSEELEKYLSLNPVVPEDRVQNARAMRQFLKAYGSLELGKREDTTPRYDIQLESFFGLLIARVFLNGEGPYKFLLDSGATTTVLSNQLFDQLQLKPAATATIRCLGGSGKMVTKIGLLKKLKLGSLELANLPVVSFDNSGLAHLVDGILCLSEFSEFLITIDPAAPAIILQDPELAGNGGKASLVPAGTPLDCRMMGNMVLLPASVRGVSQGYFLFDTGALMSALSTGTARRLGVDEKDAISQMDMQFAGACGVTQTVLPVKDALLQVKDISKEYGQILALDLTEISKELQAEIQGILGIDFWGKRRLTVDYDSATLWIE